MKKEEVKLQNGKVVIDSKEVLRKLEDQGMNFNNDGTLDLNDGANLVVDFHVST